MNSREKNCWIDAARILVEGQWMREAIKNKYKCFMCIKYTQQIINILYAFVKLLLSNSSSFFSYEIKAVTNTDEKYSFALNSIYLWNEQFLIDLKYICCVSNWEVIITKTKIDNLKMSNKFFCFIWMQYIYHCERWKPLYRASALIDRNVHVKFKR